MPLPQSFREQKAQEIPFEADALKRQAFIVWTGALRQRSADNQSFADLAIRAAMETETDADDESDERSVLLSGTGLKDRLDLARRMMQSQGIAARVVNGVYLGEIAAAGRNPLMA